MTDTYDYDVFGAIRASTGSSANVWLFTGEQEDSDSELYFLRARYYDPATGGFLTRDPLRLGNRYSYVGNNPVLLVDPYGLFGFPKIPNPINAAKDAAGAVFDAAGDYVVDPAVDFISEPENLVAIGQLVGGAGIAFGCFSPAVALCAAGAALYGAATLYEVFVLTEPGCERNLALTTGIAGGLPIAGNPAFIVAGLSGVADAIVCSTPAYAPGPPTGPGPVYVSAGGLPGKTSGGPGGKE